jgi:uncharacterized protein (TIGR00730 family)
MRTRVLLSAWLALASALPAAAQVRAVPGSVSVVPSFSPLLAPGAAPSFSAPALSISAPWIAPSLAPAVAPSFTPSLAPIPALAASVIPAASASPFQPAAFAPARIPGSAPAKDVRPRGAGPGYKDLGKLAASADGAAFDGSAAKAAVDEPALPLGARSVTVVRVETPAEAAAFMPTSQDSAHFNKELKANWSKIGWFDLRIYTDSKGGTFHAVDLSGRSGLAERLPNVMPHEADLIRKIQLHSKDLQLMILESGKKTPDLVVDGVVTEMKSLFPNGDFTLQLAHANEQVLAHTTRHRLAPGAAAIDLRSSTRVPVAKIRAAINAYVRTGAQIGLGSVSVYAGRERAVFVAGKDGLFDVQDSRRATDAQRAAFTAPPLKPAPRFLVPDAMRLTADPDASLILREVTEPIKRLRAAGVKATVTVYGSARILPGDVARAQLQALIVKYGGKPKRPEERKLVYAARQAVDVSKYYDIARAFGRIVARDGGGEVAVVTGGGPGIMEAANRGAFEAGGPSVGYNIRLDKEQGLNQYTTPGLSFEFQNFPTRKMSMRHGSMGLVYFPGGFGTMDELFEILTLMQTRKMARVPIVLIGEKAYWDKIVDFDEFARMGLISPGDLSLFRFADTAEAAWEGITSHDNR